MPARRFPPPWSVEEPDPCFIEKPPRFGASNGRMEYVGCRNRLIERRLILLRHEFLRGEGFAITELQHGHRGRLLTSAPINRRRMVAIEFGM